jgi:hypothetical protein
MSKPVLDASDLMQFTGSQEYFRHGLNRKVIYTEGVQFMAERAGAYWLIDEIALAQRYDQRVKKEDFQCWKLKVTTNTAMLTCDDGNGKVVFSKHIDFTDFPLDEIDLWVEGGTILLPSEH